MTTEPRPPSTDDKMPTAEPQDEASKYWIARGTTHHGVAAMHPQENWQGYHAWTRKMLQQWTFERVKADRPRYKRAVDLGCGVGDWSEMFATVSDELYACDVSPDFVEATKARTQGHPSVHAVASDIRTFEVPQGIDLAYVGAVLMYVDEQEAIDVMRRIKTNAVPGAHVLIREYCTINFGRRGHTPHSVHRTPQEIVKIATAAGLETIEVKASPAIYADVLGKSRWLAWPINALWRTATLYWTRASYTFRFRA